MKRILLFLLTLTCAAVAQVKIDPADVDWPAGGTSAKYWRGDQSWAVLDKTAVGLSAVDNTSDLDKPISTATQTALDGKQASAALLTSWALVARAAGYDAFATTPSSANLRTLLMDATGTGSAVFGTSPTLVTPSVDTINGATSDGDLTLAPLGTGRIAYAYSDSVRIWAGKYPWTDATATDNAVLHLRTAADTGGGSFLRFDRSRGTISAPTAVQAGDYLAGYSGRGYDGTSYGHHSDISFELMAFSNFTPSSHASYFRWVTTPSASVTKLTSMRLLPNGDLSLGYPGGNDQGEIAPERGFHAFGSQGRAFTVDTYSATENALFIGRRARGNYGAGTAVQAGDILVALGGRGWHNSGAFSSGSRGGLRVLSGESWTTTAQGAYVEIFATANAAISAVTAARFESAAATLSGSLTTGNPTGGTAAAWRLGSRVAATVALDTAQYLEVEVAGTAYKVAIAN